MQESRPEDPLARFVVAIVAPRARSQRVAADAGPGARPYPAARRGGGRGGATARPPGCSPAARAAAPHAAIACRFSGANPHPDHRTLADVRTRCLDEWAGLFTEGRRIAPAMGRLQLGSVSRDGTTLTASARQHQARRLAPAHRLEAQLKDAVAQRRRTRAAKARDAPAPGPGRDRRRPHQARAGLPPLPAARPAGGAGRRGTGG